MPAASRALSGSVAIVGAAETDAIGRLPGKSALQLHAEAAVNAMADAGLTPRDIDGVLCAGQSPVAVTEYLGIVPTYIDGTGLGGSLPMNTNGGGLSYTHTGMYGMFAIQESVRQLRGEAAAQVPGVTVSMAHGPGGMFSAAGTLILSTERRA